MRVLVMNLLVLSVLLVSCTLLPRSSRFPNRFCLVRDRLVIHSDFRVSRHHQLLDELVEQQAYVSRMLTLPISEEPIHVFLFNSAEEYERYMQGSFPLLPRRPAFFVEDENGLAIYAHWSDRVAEDLRHEVAHGYLHSGALTLPLWLDEGLAEFFEVPQTSGGINLPHIDLLIRSRDSGNWKPDLSVLESKSTLAEMLQLDYAEAWLWSHWLLKTTSKRRNWLQQHLKDLCHQDNATSLSRRIQEKELSPCDAVLDHLDSLQEHGQ